MLGRIMDRFLSSLPSSKAEADCLADIKHGLVSLDRRVQELGLDRSAEMLRELEANMEMGFSALMVSQEENREALARMSSRFCAEARDLQSRIDRLGILGDRPDVIGPR